MTTTCVVYERPLDDLRRNVYLTICLYLALLQKGFKVVIGVLEFILWKICVYVYVFHIYMCMLYTTHHFNVFECFLLQFGKNIQLIIFSSQKETLSRLH